MEPLDRANPLHAAELEDVYATACNDAVAVGDLRAALATARLILDADLHGDYPYLSVSKVLPALVLTGDLPQARRLAPAMWDGWLRAGRPPAVWLPAAARFAALAHGMRGESGTMATWQARAADAAGSEPAFHGRHAPLATFVAARVAVHAGTGNAAQLVAAAFAHPADARYRTYAVAAAAELAVVAGLPDAAARLRPPLRSPPATTGPPPASPGPPAGCAATPRR